MAHRLQALLDTPIIELDTIDSTNNYAMRLIDADTALPGLTIVAKCQTAGRGQRSRQWLTDPGVSLLMSIIVAPECPLDRQSVFNCAVAAAVADVISNIHEHWRVHIKWPNDIIINDKKAGGILIENVIRGNSWTYSVIGLGVNLYQTSFPEELPYATSLKVASGRDIPFHTLMQALRNRILEAVSAELDTDSVMQQYNDYLYRRDMPQAFIDGNNEWSAMVQEVGTDGRLQVLDGEGEIAHYTHGSVTWKWG